MLIGKYSAGPAMHGNYNFIAFKWLKRSGKNYFVRFVEHAFHRSNDVEPDEKVCKPVFFVNILIAMSVNQFCIRNVKKPE